MRTGNILVAMNHAARELAYPEGCRIEHAETPSPRSRTDAFETGAPEGTLGAEEELWLADPETLKLAGGAQKILDAEPEDLFSGELIDCEIESNTGVHASPRGWPVTSSCAGASCWGTPTPGPAFSARAGRIRSVTGGSRRSSDKPHYQRLKKKLGWLIRRNNTFSLHVHYAVSGREKAIYLFNRLREYVPHMLALSVNSPFWQGEYTDMHSVRVLIFSRAYHRAGLPGPLTPGTST